MRICDWATLKVGTTMATLAESQAVLRQLSPTQEKVDQAVAIAIAVTHPSRVFLFGSWARGEAEWDSDLDLAVLVPDSAGDELGRIRKELRRRLGEVSMTIDLILATDSHAQESSESVNNIFHTIVRRGRLVYEHRENSGCSGPSV